MRVTTAASCSSRQTDLSCAARKPLGRSPSPRPRAFDAWRHPEGSPPRHGRAVRDVPSSRLSRAKRGFVSTHRSRRWSSLRDRSRRPDGRSLSLCTLRAATSSRKPPVGSWTAQPGAGSRRPAATTSPRCRSRVEPERSRRSQGRPRRRRGCTNTSPPSLHAPRVRRLIEFRRARHRAGCDGTLSFPHDDAVVGSSKSPRAAEEPPSTPKRHSLALAVATSDLLL